MDWRLLNPYEVLAVVFSLVCVLLTIKENIWQWLVGIFGVIFYIVVFYQAKLYANMWLQVVFIVLQLYGWYEWLYGGKGKTELKISRSSLQLNFLMVVLAIAGTTAMGYGFAKFTDNENPFVDSAVTVLSLIAQWMLAKKYLENWLFWILVNVLTISMSLSHKPMLLLTAGLYALFFILAILGFLEWRKSYKNLQQG
jgi:nicotinamide mononucleotide transporter